MLQAKEAKLKEYVLLTKAMLTALKKGAADDFYELLDKREDCIASMKELDEKAGSILMNENMKLQLQEMVPIEKQIEKLLQQMLLKLSQQTRHAQNETFLTKQYEDSVSVSRGIFYDKKK
ncbi:hypothetical protein [Bacillus sp. B15-48]|uniref:hypothetical protein n=1 Tax=Bacillus sp. B15-48 TaxID=1548601 RepID=UPI00193FF961|nr:hypothetical protein [Bacillus sp. B15-48]MBM4764132.1 hypothetical protein [Bacillus sp. B15-48]